jgi:hypothetical protein
MPDSSKRGNAPQINQYQQPLNSAVARQKTPSPKFTHYNFGAKQKIQAKQIRMSKANVLGLIQLSALGSAIGTCTTGQTLYLQSILQTSIPHNYDFNFALPYLAIYQGTAMVAGSQVYPTTGTGITPGAYTITGGYDLNTFGTLLPGSVASVWSGLVVNNSAGSFPLLFVSRWKWINFDNGTVTQSVTCVL